jgi:hypothetical protein
MEPNMSRHRKIGSIPGNPRVRADDPEPSLGELLGDPVLHLLMARDGVACADLLDIVDAARSRLGVDAPRAQAVFEASLCAECRV